MSDAATITVEFGEPYHGWLPLKCYADGLCLELAASNVPANPLDALCEAIAAVSAGGSAQVIWFLEPAECCFSFENQASKTTLTIFEKEGRGRTPSQLFQLTGNAEEILLPFLHALKLFSMRAYSEAHWPKLAKHRLTHLSNLLRK